MTLIRKSLKEKSQAFICSSINFICFKKMIYGPGYAYCFQYPVLTI